MTSQAGQQRITIHILRNISRRKGDQGMKFGQLIKHGINFFFKIIQKISQGELVPDLFLFFKKALYKEKASVSTLILIYFGRS